MKVEALTSSLLYRSLEFICYRKENVFCFRYWRWNTRLVVCLFGLAWSLFQAVSPHLHFVDKVDTETSWVLARLKCFQVKSVSFLNKWSFRGRDGTRASVMGRLSPLGFLIGLGFVSGADLLWKLIKVMQSDRQVRKQLDSPASAPKPFKDICLTFLTFIEYIPHIVAHWYLYINMLPLHFLLGPSNTLCNLLQIRLTAYIPILNVYCAVGLCCRQISGSESLYVWEFRPLITKIGHCAL